MWLYECRVLFREHYEGIFPHVNLKKKGETKYTAQFGFLSKKKTNKKHQLRNGRMWNKLLIRAFWQKDTGMFNDFIFEVSLQSSNLLLSAEEATLKASNIM